MQEWWANVYPPETPGEPGLAVQWPTREGAQKACGSLRVLCRIHVRLKPEGAPKRYASEAEQGCWNNFPITMRGLEADAYEAMVASWDD